MLCESSWKRRAPYGFHMRPNPRYGTHKRAASSKCVSSNGRLAPSRMESLPITLLYSTRTMYIQPHCFFFSVLRRSVRLPAGAWLSTAIRKLCIHTKPHLEHRGVGKQQDLDVSPPDVRIGILGRRDASFLLNVSVATTSNECSTVNNYASKLVGTSCGT